MKLIVVELEKTLKNFISRNDEVVLLFQSATGIIVYCCGNL